MLFVLTLVLSKTTVSFLAISKAHQQDNFIVVSMGFFLFSSLVVTIIQAMRAALISDAGRSSSRRRPLHSAGSRRFHRCPAFGHGEVTTTSEYLS